MPKSDKTPQEHKIKDQHFLQTKQKVQDKRPANQYSVVEW